MLTINHTLVGASVGKIIGNPVLAFTAGVFLHYIFDKIPHYWPDNNSYKAIIIVIDTLVVILIIGFLVFSNASQGMIWGALGGAIVDGLLVLAKPFRESKIGKWHSKRQIHKNSPYYLLIDALIIILNVGYLLK